ncbi:hypothetical protein POM88_000018 [Heracleum sosnowskyi]|uniref:rRNA N-glycosylase n=1 Tax=Heracleum sosnowskyi TaxID=360622 RepID=A0AAD8NAF3_9APIA|nr:hypothetical protein POM88_054942 [Heracleum sosnowskyi]KAK1400398.1 hypothetical protein POM88_000003 [Heracleum sosnowskyi]KAK1400405.1 hypothetical protein POM88_000010 [Heracleum sosnowskyi]KAK1400413.1 hypothetical protein POM88_000018 [Heracleum sosnowskyi]
MEQELEHDVDNVKLNVFVHEIRRYVGKELENPKIPISVLILPNAKEIEEGQEYFRVLLFSEFYDKGVYVLIGREDLYIVAMRPRIDGEPWLIFRDTETKNNSVKTFLNKKYPIVLAGDDVKSVVAPFGVSYGSLKGHSKCRSTIPLGKEALQKAVLSLGKKQGNRDSKELALQVTVVIGSISEATRFKSVLNSIMLRYHKDKFLDEEIMWQEQNWGNLSELLRDHAFGKKPILKVKYKGNDITTTKALEIVAVIKAENVNDTPETSNASKSINKKLNKRK